MKSVAVDNQGDVFHPSLKKKVGHFLGTRGKWVMISPPSDFDCQRVQIGWVGG
jgi:hypothetical protein